MQLRDLAWLVALADHQHVTDTAAVLHTSQPTLSRALARTEAELGTRVFERASDGVHPTPTGQLVLAAARDLTTRYDQLLADLAGVLDPDTGVVRLAFLDSIASSLVPRVLRTFHEHAPGVRVMLSQEPAHEIVRDLEVGAVDLAILSPRPAGDFGWHPLQEERLVLVVPPGHRLRRRKRIALRELAGEDLVTTPVGFGFRAMVDTLLDDAGVSPAISFESQDLATIEGLVAAGLGVAIVPQPFAGQSGTVGIAIAAEAARRTIGLAWRTDRKLSAPARRFRDFVADGAIHRKDVGADW
ncbi:LysR family transcriptional regulator [Actinopolymorpha cephalotaxi]|uniref:DNA-binding transcriptional LysR family regulator n=1 Tax=Actinopolymorpha cephalotaxi TaxID=504797 RepID=A0ABX2RX02_9ACTN|nr:LysR family transcriptional regulator [Actinopolymorpha cephalotaxi]NYH81893.1 DNA-binding transcriptional LysR family regulator [Actinopolymorpha cephalotaxi]